MTRTHTGRLRVGGPLEISPWLRRCSSAFVVAATVGWLAGPVSTALAATTWHGDLASATEASGRSQKPTLLIFTAAWSPSCEEFVRTTLSAAEVTAILDACFEPVRLDVDAAAAVAKQYGVAQLPAACVLDASGRLLARFECPGQPAEFVRLAASASRETTAQVVAPASTPAPQSPTEPSVAAAQAVDRGTVQPGGLPLAAPESDAIPTQPQPAYQAPASAFSASPSTVGPEIRPGMPAAPAGAGLPAPTAPTAGYRGTQSAFTSQNAAAAATTPGIASPVATGSAFTSRAAEQPAMPPTAGFAATGIESRPFVEPVTAQPTIPQSTPWLGGPAAPQTGAFAAQPSQPSAPMQATQPGQAARPFQPAPAASVATYSGFPGYANVPPPATGGQPAVTSGQTTTSPIQPEATPAPAEENPVVSFFRKPLAAFPGWPSRKESTQPQTPSTGQDTKAPIVKPAEQALAATTPPAATPRPTGGMPLGLEGYCPVTLREKAAWVEGRAQYGACHRGRTYLFAGESEQRTFLSDPDRYAPALSGDDPVMAFDAGRQVPGQRQYGVTFQSRVYLFSSPETQSVFTAAPERYVGRVMVAENPNAAGAVLR